MNEAKQEDTKPEAKQGDTPRDIVMDSLACGFVIAGILVFMTVLAGVCNRYWRQKDSDIANFAVCQELCRGVPLQAGAEVCVCKTGTIDRWQGE